MFRLLRTSLAFALLIALSLSISAQSPQAAPRDRVHGEVADADAVTLLGNTHPLARAEFDRGALPADTRLERMMLVLQPGKSQQRALDSLTEAQQEPGSPLFHQWLTPQAYGSQFGISQNDLAQVSAWLVSHGFTVEPAPASRRLIVFSGTAAQVSDAFHTTLHRYEVQGQLHIANAEDPQIPRALAPVIAGLVSLHDFRRVSAIRSRVEVSAPSNNQPNKSHPNNDQGTAHYLAPADFETIYDLAPLDKAGYNGSGSSLAIVGRSNINLSDISTFRSYAGLPANQPKVILPNGNPGLISGDQDEATLDVEWSGGVAPAASIQYVATASTATTDGVDLSAQYIVNNKIASVMSTSFGSCEANMGAGELAFYNALWQQAAAEGISAFVSSGDSGASGCSGGSSAKGSGLGVNGLCSSTYSTCVGGTEFNEGTNSAKYWASVNGSGSGSALSYIPEQVWNESAANGGSGLWASGGGISSVYAQPAWQKGVSGASSNAMRAVPDVALTAASHDGYLVCENGSWYAFAGTSASSPSFAGILSRIVQSQAGKAQGSVNPILYSLLSASSNPFHATPSGNNSVPGVTGYTASGASYNLTTGLGSVDAGLLRSSWPAAVVAPGFTLTSSATTFSLLPGKSTTFTVSVSPAGGFTGVVALTAQLPAGVTLTFSPASIGPGATATATLSVSSTASASSTPLALTINGASGTLKSSASVSLTILPATSLTVSAAAASLSVVQGKSATLAITVNSGGNYTGPVALSLTGLPSGVTAAWSANNVSLSGTASHAFTLTLQAASTAAVSTSALQVTASGDNLQAKTPVSLQVTPAPSIQLGLASSQITMASNGSQTFSATITVLGGVVPSYSSNGVSFQFSGLPAGIVNVAWGASYAQGSNQILATFNLAGGASAVAGKSTVTLATKVIDGNSGLSYTASQTFTLTVTKATQVGHPAATITIEPGLPNWHSAR